MLRALLDLLTGQSAEPPTPEDARLALAAILVRAARADDDYAESERAAIEAVLMDRYALSPNEATELREQAEAAEAFSVDLVRFTRAVKQSVPIEERRAVMQALWRVILSDHTRDPDEDALARQTASLLGVADRDSALARIAAAEELGEEPT